MASHDTGSSGRWARNVMLHTEALHGKTTLATRSEEDVIADLHRHRQESRYNAVLTMNNISRGSGDDIIGSGIENQLEILDMHEVNDGEHSEDEIIETPKPKKISERRRLRDAKFDAFTSDWAAKNVRKATIGESEEESQSTKWLVKQSESQDIISSPRDYQVELFEKAKLHNSIAVLDTGSGKTLIAIMLLRHVIEQELEDRAIEKQKRLSFFLVDSVALVFQQYAALDANLDHPMERFCGDMIGDHGSKRLWDKVFSNNLVIVCTAEVLYHCLHRSFITMNRINLLIFDEAHHAKKNHVYARIMRDFYIQEEKIKRPKIFGMTASPVDSNIDVQKAASELETLLHSRIVTASDPTVMQYETRSRQEAIADYAPLPIPFETPLYQQLKVQFGDIAVLRKPLLFAKEATAELGTWCADRVWQFCFTEEETRKLISQTEKNFLSQKIAGPLKGFDDEVARIREAQEIIKAIDFPPPNPKSNNLSSKVIRLMVLLRERYERQTNDKCIVFVDRRYTARLLTELFGHKNIGTPHLRPGTLVGFGNGTAGELTTSLREQVLILRRFRRGIYNCLFATSVAEEGLDIPDCNLVIRFDLYRTVTQYIQSRGRARLANSKYIHMMETRNRLHAALIKNVNKNENVLRNFCHSLPADRLLTGNDHDMAEMLAKEKSYRVFTETKTGAKLNYRVSLMVLANFVASLPRPSEGTHHPEYVMMPRGKLFICEVILPISSPVRGAIGQPHSTKQAAKCAAAFDVCIKLRKEKLINEYFQSTYTKQLPVMRNALLSVNSNKQEAYDMRIKPKLWTTNETPAALYLTAFILEDPDAVSRPSQPLAILTRSPLPQFPEFPLFLGKGLQSHVKSVVFTEPIEVDQKMLASVDAFTLRIFDDVFSKQYESNLSQMPYFFVPLKDNHCAGPIMTPSELIDWDIMYFVEQNKVLEWDENTPEDFFQDRYLIDRWDGSRKLWAVKVTHRYRPLDPVPPNTAPRQGTRKNNNNIMEYSISLWAKARALRTFKEDQPVIEAEYIPLRRNLLDDNCKIDSEIPRKCFVIPEPLTISALPTKVVTTAYLLPAIIHRIESYLIALEACDLLHIAVPPVLALEAMTKDSDNTEEHEEQQIHFQRGMGKNYERLEFLGDCFLKMATTIAIFTQHPDSDEYQYHVKRMLLICNKNLWNNARGLKLYEYIRSQGFNRRAWYPEGLILKRGKSTFAPKEHALSDKTIADICEALIGAALLATHSSSDMDIAVRAVTELVCSTDHTMTKYADYYKLYEMPKYQIAAATASQRDLAAKVAIKHPYTFKYPRLVRSAFVHPSYPFSYEHVPSYQRLEFLGDSLLDMACINWLFHRYPNRDPHWLTEHKMAMVSNQFLGALCVALGFHKHLLSFSSMIQSQIAEYVTEIADAREQAEDEAEMSGKPRSSYSPDFWVHTKQPPKCLPDVVEAYIGAVFVDSEYDYKEVERFFDMHIKCYFEDMSIYDTFANKHPVTFLANLMSKNLGCTEWHIHAKELPNVGDGLPPQIIATVMVHNEIIAVKEGVSARYAKVKVAKMALDMLAGLGLPDFRSKFGCNCEVADFGEEAEEDSHGTAI